MKAPRNEWERLTRIRPLQGETGVSLWICGTRPGEFLPNDIFDTGQPPLFRDWPTKGGLAASVFLLASMLPGVRGIRRFVSLSIEPNLDALGRSTDRLPGTAELACVLDIEHPLNWNGEKIPLVTGLVITCISEQTHQSEMLAVAIRDQPPIDVGEIECLRLEREYWRCRGVKWMLITFSEIHRNVHRRLFIGASVALSRWRAPMSDLVKVRQEAQQIAGRPYGPAVATVADLIGCSFGQAFFVFWQSVWQGHLCLDFRRSDSLSAPLRLVSPRVFASFNPLLVGRSNSCLDSVVSP